MAVHTFLITGASSGIGLQLVRTALEAGHKVLATSRDPQTSAARYPMVAQQGGRWLKLDVTDKGTENVVQNIVRDNNVDILINNAGYAMLGSMEEMSVDEFETQLQTNTIGAVRCIKGAVPFFRQQGRGTIVNVSSLAGYYGSPGTTAYSASKFALNGLSEALAREVGIFGIRVLLVVPGSFRTNLVSNLVVPASKIDDYDGTPSRELVNLQQTTNGQQPGDPVKGAQRIIEVAIDAAGDELAKRGKGKALRVFLGKDCLGVVNQTVRTLEEDLNMMQDIGESTDFV